MTNRENQLQKPSRYILPVVRRKRQLRDNSQVRNISEVNHLGEKWVRWTFGQESDGLMFVENVLRFGMIIFHGTKDMTIAQPYLMQMKISWRGD